MRLLLKAKGVMKQYTPIRQFYAWVGFVFLASILFLLVLGVFVPNTTNYVIKVQTPHTEDSGDPESTVQGIITAYTSSVEETDDTPFITASNETVRDGIVANNCLPFGTEVVIDGKVYEVQDRMNSRYGCEWFDIWMTEKAAALEWGVRDRHVVIR